MAVRMMSYVGLLYQDLIKAKQVLPHRRLPPVLPIVLYNGDARWTAATSIADLIPKVPGLVAQFLPSMEYLLISENQYTQSHLAKMHNLVAAVMRLQHSPDQATVLEIIDLLNGWLVDNPELMRIFAIWIRAVLLRQSKNELTLPKVQDLKELKMTLAARLEEWALQSEKKGMEKGMEKGIAQGMERGRSEERMELARKLKQKKMPMDEIMELTGLAPEDIETL